MKFFLKSPFNSCWIFNWESILPNRSRTIHSIHKHFGNPSKNSRTWVPILNSFYMKSLRISPCPFSGPALRGRTLYINQYSTHTDVRMDDEMWNKKNIHPHRSPCWNKTLYVAPIYRTVRMENSFINRYTIKKELRWNLHETNIVTEFLELTFNN